MTQANLYLNLPSLIKCIVPHWFSLIQYRPSLLITYCSLSPFLPHIIKVRLFFLTSSGTESTAAAGSAHANPTKRGKAEKREGEQEEEKTSKPEDRPQAEGSYPSQPPSPAVPPPSGLPLSSPNPELSAT